MNKKLLLSKTMDLKIQRLGAKAHPISDLFYYLLKARWRSVLTLFVICYLVINSFFAGIYWLGGDTILNASPGSYWDAWFFSFQTSSTIGYGQFLPKTTFAHIIVIFDTLSGLLFVTIATGLTFTKFSRPSMRVFFSENVLLTNWYNKPTMMFRIGNERNNHIVDAHIVVSLLKPEASPEGVKFNRLYDLKLERSQTPVFGLTWTVFHTIDQDSPLFGLSIDEIQSQEIGLVVSFRGLDNVYSQTVHTRYGYTADKFLSGHQFVDLFYQKENGERYIDYNQFHKVKSCPTES